MENFVITFSSKPGKEDAVADFYVSQQAEYDKAKGFRGRQILRARPGTMADALRKVMTPEQMAQHPEPPNDGAIHFIIIEKWDSIEDRMAFSATMDKSRNAELFPNLLPKHTHEYYTDITPK
jgi:heme-degrading monooxygenase HmoA